MGGVIVHDFEVIAEPPPASPEAQQAPAGGAEGATRVLSPHDIEGALRRARARALRVRAY